MKKHDLLKSSVLLSTILLSSSIVSAGVVPKPQSVGCFVDKVSPRSLPTELASSNTTIESCDALARAKSFAYFGLQNGGQCWAGNAVGDVLDVATACATPCNANTAETCGGTNHNSIYFTGLTPLASFFPVSGTTRMFPPDSGFVNVKTQYGAKGDGVTDDTLSIQNAISAISQTTQRVLFFPSGTYLISKPLEEFAKNNWKSYLTIQGQGQSSTTIKLTSNNSLYNLRAGPTSIIRLGSENPLESSGGGNDGFDNFIFDITLDTGEGNPHAVGVDFMGNNYCGMRNVTIQSSDPSHEGWAGIIMERYSAGPCLMKNITVNGFNYGVEAETFDYGVTISNLVLTNQLEAGVYNNNDTLEMENLTSLNSVPAIQNVGVNGLVTIIGGTFAGGSSSLSSIQNTGVLYARNIATSGYKTAIDSATLGFISGTSVKEYDSSAALTLFDGPSSSLNLPIKQTPVLGDEQNAAKWISVVAMGADPTGVLDSTAAIQAAIEVTATTVYFPSGKYKVSGTIHVNHYVTKLAGFDSELLPAPTAFQDAANPIPLLQIDSTGTGPLMIDHLLIGNSSTACLGMIAVLNNSPRELILTDSAFQGGNKAVGSNNTGYANTALATGPLYVEDISASPWIFSHPQTVYARQINPEGNGMHILNNGGSLWMLGLKTEGTGTLVETDNGGKTELLGGFIYPTTGVPIDESAFVINDSETSLIYSLTSYGAPSTSPYPNYQNQVEETQNGITRNLPTTAVPKRGYGSMMPLYSSKP